MDAGRKFWELVSVVLSSYNSLGFVNAKRPAINEADSRPTKTDCGWASRFTGWGVTIPYRVAVANVSISIERIGTIGLQG